MLKVIMEAKNKIYLNKIILILLLVFTFISCKYFTKTENTVNKYSFEFNNHKISFISPFNFKNNKINSLELPFNRGEPDNYDKYILIENEEKTNQIFFITSKDSIPEDQFETFYKNAVQRRFKGYPQNIVLSKKIQSNIFSIITLQKCFAHNSKNNCDFSDTIAGTYEYIVFFDSIRYYIVYNFETEMSKFNHYEGQKFIESINFE
jgi:hypothetical protein